MPTELSITILSDKNSWINEWIPQLVDSWTGEQYSVRWIHQADRLDAGGDLAFFLGCGQLVCESLLRCHKHNLVVHASDLPQGRGWSPMTWLILAGESRVPVTLFEAIKELDAGPIYDQQYLNFAGHELLHELREALGEATIRLCSRFVAAYPESSGFGEEQRGIPSYYTRRRPHDSQLDPNRSISEQFNLLRVVDNDFYPAFFVLHGYEYRLRVEKVRKVESE